MHIVKTTLVIVCFMIMATQGAFAREDGTIKESRILMRCMYGAAWSTDDGISDVATLAPLVATSCQKAAELLAWRIKSGVEIENEGKVPNHVFEASVTEISEVYAGKAILLLRADKRAIAK